MNKLVWDINNSEACLNEVTYIKGVENASSYYEYGRHAVFFCNEYHSFGCKFFIVKNVCYDISKINELYDIHKLMFNAGFGVEVFGLCSCFYKGNLHYGLIVEKLSKRQSYLNSIFPLNDFKKFCRSVNGLIKREYFYELLYGEKWHKINPNLEFNVGDNNIMFDINGIPKLIDIDPRWQLKR